jgi:DNA-binding CsgD family transcriptional regulator
MQVFPTRHVDQVALALIDELDTGVLACTGQGAVVLANWAAQQELNHGRWLRAPNGVLEACSGSALADALLVAASRGRRRLLCLNQGGERLFVTTSPLRGNGEESLVLVIIGRRLPFSRLSLELLASSHGLTEAERKVLAGLAGRSTPREIAEAHGVELSTVRSQVGAVHLKLGVRTHGETLSLVAGLPQLASALRVLPAAAVNESEAPAATRQARAA